jgi:hypothetical protein
MLRSLVLSSYGLAERRLEHPNWLIRRSAQASVLALATISLALPRADAEPTATRDPSTALVRQLSASAALREAVQVGGRVKRRLACVFRALLMRLSVAAEACERQRHGERRVALRVAGPIDQRTLRNLLIWQNHVLPSQLSEDRDRQVDVALALANGRESEPRLFDLLSIALMLERVRNVTIVWDEVGAAPSMRAGDLDAIPRDVIGHVEVRGTRGGVKLLPDGRKRANDFFKLAWPGRRIVAVGLLEREDGTAEPAELELWLGLIERLGRARTDIAFVMLNRLAPSQWREWPAHVRFARHQGLTLQDAVGLAQVADGYLGVLDIFGLAAHSAARPGVYVPLDQGGLPSAGASPANATGEQLMVGSRDRARIETAVDTFVAAMPSP